MSFQGATSQVVATSPYVTSPYSFAEAAVQPTQGGPKQPHAVANNNTHKRTRHRALCEVRVGEQEQSNPVKVAVVTTVSVAL